MMKQSLYFYSTYFERNECAQHVTCNFTSVWILKANPITVEPRISGIFGHSEFFYYCEVFHYFDCSLFSIPKAYLR